MTYFGDVFVPKVWTFFRCVPMFVNTDEIFRGISPNVILEYLIIALPKRFY